MLDRIKTYLMVGQKRPKTMNYHLALVFIHPTHGFGTKLLDLRTNKGFMLEYPMMAILQKMMARENGGMALTRRNYMFRTIH